VPVLETLDSREGVLMLLPVAWGNNRVLLVAPLVVSYDVTRIPVVWWMVKDNREVLAPVLMVTVRKSMPGMVPGMFRSGWYMQHCSVLPVDEHYSVLVPGTWRFHTSVVPPVVVGS
jgi:hypothetical protein